MIEAHKNSRELNMTRSSIEYCADRLRKEFSQDSNQIFFVVFTPPYRLFKRHEEGVSIGYFGLFFLPGSNLPNDGYAWDIVMYSLETGEAIARIKNRPEP